MTTGMGIVTRTAEMVMGEEATTAAGVKAKVKAPGAP
jgi:hypothetical protein